MTDRITLEVTRYHPAHDEEPGVQAYEVPLRKDWVVLDALNYIKDQLDGSLTFRWSCRMGVCGSCGMMVNGVPKLTCATFLSDYAPGPVRVEPMKNFPVLRDLVVDTSDFLVKLDEIETVDHSEGGKAARGWRISPNARTVGCIQAVQHVHQLHAVLRGLSGLRIGPAVQRTRGHRPGSAIQHGLARPGRE